MGASLQGMLGSAQVVDTYVDQQSPPSSYAIAGALEGEPGAWGRVLLVTALRAFCIAPGLYLGGVRGKHVVTGSVMAAVTITGALFMLYGLKRACSAPPAQLAAARSRLGGL
jgi:hypothetical protein